MCIKSFLSSLSFSLGFAPRDIQYTSMEIARTMSLQTSVSKKATSFPCHVYVETAIELWFEKTCRFQIPRIPLTRHRAARLRVGFPQGWRVAVHDWRP